MQIVNDPPLRGRYPGPGVYIRGPGLPGARRGRNCSGGRARIPRKKGPALFNGGQGPGGAGTGKKILSFLFHSVFFSVLFLYLLFWYPPGGQGLPVSCRGRGPAMAARGRSSLSARRGRGLFSFPYMVSASYPGPGAVSFIERCEGPFWYPGPVSPAGGLALSAGGFLPGGYITRGRCYAGPGGFYAGAVTFSRAGS